MNYEKTALSYTEILQQLKSRGLNFQNESLALQELSHNKSKLYNLLCCIIYLLDNIQPNNNFRTKLNQLLTKYNKINLYSMGFPRKWREEDLWNKNL